MPRGRFEAYPCMLGGLFQTHWSICFTRARSESTHSLVGRASDSPSACVVSLGHFIPIALLLIKPRKPFSFSRHGVDYCCFKMTENLFTGP